MRVVLLALLFGALALAGYTLWPFRDPLILAAVLAALCQPVHRLLLRAFPNRPNVAALLLLLGVTLLIVLPLLLLLSLLTAQGVKVLGDITSWVGQVDLTNLTGNERIAAFSRWLDRQLETITWLEASLGVRLLDVEELRRQVLGLSRNLGQIVLAAGTSLLGNLAGLMANFFVMIFAGFFLVRDGEAIIRWLKAMLPLREEQEDRILGRIRAVIRAVFLGNFLTALCQGTVAALGMVIVGVPALFWGTVLGLASLVPIVGTGLVWIPIFCYLLLFGELWQAIFWAAWASLLVGSLDNFLRPVFIQGGTELPTFTLFMGIIGGLNVFGIAGMLYGPLIIAFATVMVYIYQHEYRQMLSEANQAQDADGEPEETA